MKKVIINTNRNWDCVDCYSTCTPAERKECIHCECYRRNLRSEGGLELCPLIKNGRITINEEFSRYIQQ